MGATGASEALEYGVGSFHFTARRPFHPRRRWDVLEPLVDGGGAELSTGAGASAPSDAVGGDTGALGAGGGDGGAKVVRRTAVLLRSKGLVWLASRSDQVGDWSQAGADVHFDYGGRWFVAK